MATATGSWTGVGNGVEARVIVNLNWSGGILSWSGQIETRNGWASGNDPWEGTGAFAASGTANWKTSTNGKTTIKSGSRTVAQKSSAQSFSQTFKVSNLVNTSLTRSATVSLTVPGTGTGGTPTTTPPITTAYISDYRVDVSWGDPPAGVTHIELQRSVDRGPFEWMGRYPAVISTSGGTRTYHPDKTTRPNRHYRYRGKWANASMPPADQYGPWSASYSNAWEDTSPPKPAPPSVSRTAAGDIRVGLTQPPSGDVGTGATWEVQATTDGGSTWTTVKTGIAKTATSWTHTGTDPALSYAYRTCLRAEYGDQPRSWYSDPSKTITTAVKPLQPTRLGPSVADATDPITLTWRHNPGTDEAPQTGYEVAWRLWSDGTPGDGVYSWNYMGRVNSDVASAVIPAGTWENRYYDSATSTWVDGVEVRVKTYGISPSGSDFSESLLLSLNGKPVVTITEPAGTLPGPELTARWAYSDDDYGEETRSAAWRATLLSATGDVLEVRSGSSDKAVRFRTVLANEATYTLRVQARDWTGQWSAVAETTVVTVFLTPPAPTLEAWFSPDDGHTVLTVDVPAPAESEEPVDHLRIERAVPGGWAIVEAAAQPGQTVTDMIPPLGQAVTYRAVSVAAITSTAYSSHTVVDTTTNWIFINHGPGFGRVVRTQRGVSAGRRTSRERSRHHFAGRADAVELAGPAVTRTWTVSTGLLHECIVGEQPEQPTWEQFDDLAVAAAPVCLRGPHGLRAFCSVDEADESGLYEDTSQVTLKFTSIDWTENVT